MIEYHLTHDEYAARPGLNATVLKACRKSMLHGRHVMHNDRERTPALTTGLLIHTAILEPARLAARVAVWMGGRRDGKKYEQFAAQNIGREIITRGEWDELARVANIVRQNVEAQHLLSGCHYEASVFWDEPEIGPCKARVDAFEAGRPVVDVKTMRDITTRAAERQYWALGYVVQLGWYTRGLRASGITTDGAAILAVESAEPYDVVVDHIDPDYLHAGEQEAVRLAKRFRQCERASDWPGVSPSPRVMFPPAWAADEVASAGPGPSVVPAGIDEDPF